MRPSKSPLQKHRNNRLAAGAAAVVALLTIVSTALAHDFWIIPDLFSIAANETIHANGRSGTRFPAGSAVQPTRIADARVIGASSEARITEMSVEGGSLRLHQKPAAAGQYLIAVALQSGRLTRAAPAGLIRFLRAEGGAAEAARLERANAFAGMDSISYQSTSYAATTVQVGRGGPRAFNKTAGFLLEFVPVNDPWQLHVGDTLHIKLLGGGTPVASIGIDATPAADTTAGATGPAAGAVSLTADANGVVHLSLTKSGPWLLRSAFVRRKPNGTANEFEVARTTYVISVAGH
ncbi:MAG: DUF4198 domain-containing protein [Gemmatimonadota bacterium]